MKKIVATLALLMFVTAGFALVAHGAIYNEKTHRMCYDENGRFNPSDKNCDPNSCGCFFHQIEEFLKGLFVKG
jgi:hypothetical protein